MRRIWITFLILFAGIFVHHLFSFEAIPFAASDFKLASEQDLSKFDGKKVTIRQVTKVDKPYLGLSWKKFLLIKTYYTVFTKKKNAANFKVKLVKKDGKTYVIFNSSYAKHRNMQSDKDGNLSFVNKMENSRKRFLLYKIGNSGNKFIIQNNYNGKFLRRYFSSLKANVGKDRAGWFVLSIVD